MENIERVRALLTPQRYVRVTEENAMMARPNRIHGVPCSSPDPFRPRPNISDETPGPCTAPSRLMAFSRQARPRRGNVSLPRANQTGAVRGPRFFSVTHFGRTHRITAFRFLAIAVPERRKIGPGRKRRVIVYRTHVDRLTA